MQARIEQAKAVLEAATTDTPEHMRRTGWHRCSDVLDEKQALSAIEEQLGDPDYAVFATKTCTGFIVWHLLRVPESKAATKALADSGGKILTPEPLKAGQ